MKSGHLDLETLLARHFAARAPKGCEQAEGLALFAAGELDGEARASFEAHLGGCQRCREALAELDSTRSLWLRSGPEARVPWRERWWGGKLWTAGALAAAGAMAAILLMVARPTEDPLRPKGTWQLHVAVDRQGKVIRATPGERLESGDRLGFFYSSDSGGWLALYSTDETGQTARLFPASGESASVVAGREVSLPDGAALGEAHGCEWIVGMLGRHPIGAADALEALKRMRRDRSGCSLAKAQMPGVVVQVFEVTR
ncbi:MAG: zf-HC2 domain-containing protein [Deltaproteobacteria bacterium]|nr:zf-HC2 domain-containing protein [Deltaproteobacteria bacterium]